ncbi:MAG TPA: zf-HC2 domain-containing protein, partial [Gammaproteobacteria bacterium]|nr:zf-HC2 domain-containing protein [Gammaproteobacteria bacterium]
MSEINHNEAARLLPWLVNGTLAGTERERVERHVRDCLVCRAEVREQQALQVLVRQRADVPLSAEQGFEALAQRLQEAREGGRFARPRRDASGARRFNFALVRLLGGEGFQ